MIGTTTAAQIITGKYCDALPLYRQERMAALAMIAALAMVALVSCEEAGAGSDDSPDSYFTYRG